MYLFPDLEVTGYLPGRSIATRLLMSFTTCTLIGCVDVLPAGSLLGLLEVEFMPCQIVCWWPMAVSGFLVQCSQTWSAVNAGHEVNHPNLMALIHVEMGGAPRVT